MYRLLFTVSAFLLFEVIIIPVLAATAPSDTAFVMRLIKKSDKHIYNQPSKALEYAQQARDLSRNKAFIKGLTKSYERLGNVYFHMGNKRLARNNYYHAMALLEGQPDHNISGSVNYNMANLHYELGNYDSTMFFTKKASEHYLAAGNKGGYAFCIFMDAQVHEQKGNYYMALKNKLEALEIFRGQNMKIWETDCLMSIADIYSLRGEHSKALSMYQQCLVQYRELNDRKFECVSLRNIGFQYSKMKNYAESIRFLDESIHLSRDSGFVPEENKSLSRKGDVLIMMGEHAKAERAFRDALERSKTINDNYYIARNLTGLGHTLVLQGRFLDALLYLEEGLKISHPIDNKVLKRDLHHYLSMVNDSLERPPDAFSHFKLYSAYKDTILQEENSRQLDEIKAAYDIEKAENEISLLEKEKANAENIRKLTLIGWTLTALAAFLVLLFVIYKFRKNKQLLAKEKEVDKLKSKFFADISHEFRTPLTLIFGPLANLMTESRLLPFQNELGLIETNAKRLLHLINQLLDLSKLESGKYSLNISRNDFSGFLRRVLYTYQSYAEAKNIQLILKGNQNIDACFDPINLETVFNNLLSNALKFEPENGEVLVSADVIDNYVVVQVTNRGSVIPPEQQANIFNRYYSSTNGIHDNVNHTGTGIGLALAKELTMLHHGNVTVESSPNEGTTFTVRIPVNHDGKKAPKAIQSSSGHKEMFNTGSYVPKPAKTGLAPTVQYVDNQSNRSNKNLVLIIDDNKEVRDFIHTCLSRDYEILAAADGAKGIKIAGEQMPDIVISDVMMPGISGIEVCQILKEKDMTSHIPVILLTAKSSIESKLEGFISRADAYISKPFEPEELRVRIRNLLENRKLLQQKYAGNSLFKINTSPESTVDQRFLQRLKSIIADNIANENFNVEELCKEAGVSRSQMHRKLTAITGMSASEFIRNFRLEKAMDLLKSDTGTASEVAYMVGFQSPVYFNKCFREYFNTTPGAVRKSKLEPNERL